MTINIDRMAIPIEDALKIKFDAVIKAQRDIVKYLKQFNKIGLQEAFYTTIKSELSELENDILFELLNLGTGENKSIKGHYNLYDHYINNKGFINFKERICKTMVKNRLVTDDFLNVELNEMPVVNLHQIPETIPISFSRDSAELLMTKYMLTIQERIQKRDSRKRNSMNRQAVLAYEQKLSLLDLIYAFEHELRNGNTFKYWGIDKNLATEENGFAINLDDFDTENLKKLIINFISDNIVGFLAFINFISYEMSERSRVNKLPVRKIIYMV